MFYDRRMRTVGLCLVVGLVAGGAFGCMFETEFLLYAGCLDAQIDCDPAWGEARTPQHCFAPHHEDEDSPGYCTSLCTAAEECPAGLGSVADWPKQCVRARLRAKDGGVELLRACSIPCDRAAGTGACPAEMTCQSYEEWDGTMVDLCFFVDDALK